VTFPVPNLNAAEQNLIDAAQNGEVCNLKAGDKRKDDPATSDSWGDDRTIRAEVIRHLCVGTDPDVKVDYRGVRLVGARITGLLDLDDATLDSPLVLAFCRLEEPISLLNARTKSLTVDGSHLLGVLASRLESEGDVTFSGSKIAGVRNSAVGTLAVWMEGATVGGVLALDAGFEAGLEVRLTATRVGATLMCNGGSFTNGGVGRWALNADGVRAGQGISLGLGFSAQGDVNFKRAQITGFLNCAGGSFVGGTSGNALTCDGVQVTGDAYLTKDFRANGEVRLVGANIEGDLNCRGGVFENDGGNGDALTADRARVGGNVYLSHGFEALGHVRFVVAEVRGQFVCSGGRFSSKRNAAISLQGTSIGDAFFWNDLVERPEGHVNLRMAETRTLIDDSESWPGGDDALLLDGFRYEQIVGESPLDVETRLKWLESQRQGREDVGFKPQAYEQLAAVYDRMGRESDARDIRIEKRKAERKYGDLSWWRRRQNRFLDLTIAYGWKPWRVVMFGVFMILLGAHLFFIADLNGGMRGTTKLAWIPLQWLVYSLDTYLPIVDLGQESRWAPDVTAGWWAWIFQIYLWIHILLGWVVTSLGVLAFSGLVRQK
jgi:hypothetical protein